jgi:hypothetical protein
MRGWDIRGGGLLGRAKKSLLFVSKIFDEKTKPNQKQTKKQIRSFSPKGSLFGAKASLDGSIQSKIASRSLYVICPLDTPKVDSLPSLKPLRLFLKKNQKKTVVNQSPF